MVDVLTPEQRKLNMSRIRSKNTKPELLIRRGLHALGLRYRLNDRSLPGRPDLVFRQYRTAVFVHGCFWHAHGCDLSKLPVTRRDFWRKKLTANSARDRAALELLIKQGWRVIIVWECALRGGRRLDHDIVLSQAAEFIKNGGKLFYLEIPASISLHKTSSGR